VPKSFRGEVPRLFAEQLRYSAKDAAFHEHPTMEVIIAMKPREAFNGQSVQNNTMLCWVN
jgi:hypothetical protein